MTPDDSALLRRIERLTDEIERRFFPPDPITVEEFRGAMVNMLVYALDRQLSLRKAERWIREHLQPAKKTKRSVYSLKHDLDHWYQRHGSACYLVSADFADVLRHCDFRVTDDGCYVYAKGGTA